MKYHCLNCGQGLGYEGLCWKCRAEQERNEVLTLSPEQIEAKLRHLTEHAEQMDDWRTEEHADAKKLIEFLGVCPPKLQRSAWGSGVVHLEELYYHAPADVRDGMIATLLETTDPHMAAKLMCCLAMQGDDTVLDTLLELEHHPRPWRKKLYVDPSVYAQCGGWTFDRAGQRRVLNFDICYPLEKGDPSADRAIRIGRPREDACPHCGGTLMDMLVLDGRDVRLRFLGLDGILTATCCPNCVSFTEASFSRFTLDGGSTPLPAPLQVEKIEDYVGGAGRKKLAGNVFVLGKAPVPPFYGAGSEDLNTVGGFANWIQDWQYTACPDCGKPMKYLAQIQWDTIQDCAEGTLYIEFCPDCQIASTHHQQT